ncbi:MAG: hypothetical protein HY720_05855 [Planctomycetes bacterium]|nr:hypothetical protein [Planctomycetota bacterium]
MAYTARNIQEDSQARNDLVSKYRSTGTPTIVVGEKTVIIGFNKQKLNEALGLK